MSGVHGEVVLLSGGVDSAVCLARSVATGRRPVALHVRYGQRHARESGAAMAVAASLGVPLTVWSCDMPPCPLTGRGDLPAGLPPADPGQAATVVPGRNAVLASLGAALAASLGAGSVVIGANAGDAAVYADCRPAFVSALSAALEAGAGVRLEAPLLWMSKAEVVALGRTLGVDLSLTWSCYAGGEAPCGSCGACLARRGAGL